MNRCKWAADYMLEESSRHSWGAPPVTPAPRKQRQAAPSTKQADSRPLWQRYTGGLTPKARGEVE